MVRQALAAALVPERERPVVGPLIAFNDAILKADRNAPERLTPRGRDRIPGSTVTLGIMPGFPASHSVSTASQGRFELPAEAAASSRRAPGRGNLSRQTRSIASLGENRSHT